MSEIAIYLLRCRRDVGAGGARSGTGTGTGAGTGAVDAKLARSY